MSSIFMSEFSNEIGFYVYIKEFDFSFKNSIAYYTIINNKIFFVPTEMLSSKFFKILPTKKNFISGSNNWNVLGKIISIC